MCNKRDRPEFALSQYGGPKAPGNLLNSHHLMGTRMRTLCAIAIALLLPAATVQAALIEVNSPAGPATAVLDTNTGLEWLKLSVT